MSPITTLFWVQAPASLGAKVFELRTDEKKLLTIVYHEAWNSVKLESINSRRSYKLEKEGLIKNKTSIINEYGVKIGQYSTDLINPNDGRLNLHDEHFAFTNYRGTLNRIKLQDVQTKLNLFNCTVFEKDKQTEIHFAEPIQAEKYAFAIIALSWILFLPTTTHPAKHLESV